MKKFKCLDCGCDVLQEIKEQISESGFHNVKIKEDGSFESSEEIRFDEQISIPEVVGYECFNCRKEITRENIQENIQN